jgi:prophage regulatory protein
MAVMSTTAVAKLVNELKAEFKAEIAKLEQKIAQLTAQNQALNAEKSQPKLCTPEPQATATKGAILRLRDVLKLVGLSRSYLYKRIKDGTFPKQVKLGERAAGWFSADVYAFLNGLKTA